MTTLTIDGSTVNLDIEPNCWGEKFSTYFPNVIRLIVTDTTEIPFGDHTPADLLLSAGAANTTLYLNEEGYEYQKEVNLDKKTWRDVKFLAIKNFNCCNSQ